MKTITKILTIVLIYVGFYLFTSFGMWELNPAKWHSALRGFMLLCATIVSIALHEVKKEIE